MPLHQCFAHHSTYVKDEKIYFEATGDALIARGLVDILIRIYSGRSAQEILQTDSAELKALHLSEIISSGRQNGIASMVKRIYTFAGGIDNGRL